MTIPDFSILDKDTTVDEDDADSTALAAVNDVIPQYENTAILEAEIQPDASLEEVRTSDVQINNVQILTLLHGLQHVRTVNGLCKINEQISRTLRYRRDIMGMEKEKPSTAGAKPDYPLLDATPLD